MKNWKMMMASLMLAAGVAGSVSGAIQYFAFDPERTVTPGNFYSFDPYAPNGGSTTVFNDDVTFHQQEGPPGFWGAFGGGWEVQRADGWNSAATPLAANSTIYTNLFYMSGANDVSTLGDGNTAYFALRKNVSGDYYYGWIQVARSGSNYTLLGLAYNDVANEQILAGQGEPEGGGGGGSAVPEPGTAAMLGIGVVMLSAARRRFRREA